MIADRDLEAYERALARLPMLRAVEWRPSPTSPEGVDLVLTTAQGTRTFVVHQLRADVTSAAVDRLVGAVDTPGDHIALARHVPSAPGERLRIADWNYLDAAGNCRISLDERYFWFVEGRRPPSEVSKDLTRADHEAMLLFTLLAEPALAHASPGEVAARANVPVSATRTFLRRFHAENLPRPTAVHRWLADYEGGLRRRLTLGTFRPRDPHPDALEPILRQALHGRRWAFGGGWAAHQMTGYYRGPLCVVHLDEVPPELPRLLRALPDERGPLTLIRPPSPLGYEGSMPGIAHPLLVYSELMAGESDRAHEAAVEVGSLYLNLAA